MFVAGSPASQHGSRASCSLMTATQMTDFLRESPGTRSWVVSVHSSQTNDNVGTVTDGVLRCGTAPFEPAVLGTANACSLPGDA